MNAIDLLASSLNRRDDEPNQALADEIIHSGHHDWIKELIDNLNHKDKNIQSDCIKVLYEIGERGSPDMIAPYYKEFGAVLKSKNNRLVWGAMIALDMIALSDPGGVYSLLPTLISVIDKGSVITIDHGVGILAKLSSFGKYSGSTFPLLMEQLKRCPVKQLPMYAEKSEIAVNDDNKNEFLDLLETRMKETEKESQQLRIQRIIKRVRTGKNKIN